MAETLRTVLLICSFTSLLFISPAQTCLNYTFPGGQVFNFCTHLPVLQACLHWNYIPLTRTVQIAYRATQTPQGWVAWAINPMGTGMVGSQAIVAFRHSNGSMIAYTTPITSYSPPMEPEGLSIPLSNIGTEYVKNEMIIYAVLGPLGDQTTFNHVWQAGSSVLDDIPQVQPLSGQNAMSMGQINFLSP